MKISALLEAVNRSSTKPEWYHVVMCLEEPKTTQDLLDCCKARGAHGKYVMLDLKLMSQIGLVRYDYSTFTWMLTDRGRELLELLRGER